MPERLHPAEFVALMALLFSMIAFSIDSMLPALPEIAEELTADAPNRAQLILTSFVLGMGIGTLFTGPISDAMGRRPVILAGGLVYAVGAALAYFGESLEVVLAARFLQGLGAAGPRATAMAIIRDLFRGRQMARIMSFVMMVFTLVPAIAPLAGSFVIDAFGWRAIFGSFLVFAFVAMVWFGLRQRETLEASDRRPLNLKQFMAGLREVLGTRQVVLALIVVTLIFGMLFALLSSIQPIFDETFGEREAFPYWFAGIALLSGTAGILNASIVVRVGMRAIVIWTLAILAAISGLVLAAWLFIPMSPEATFAITYAWMVGVFFSIGMTIGNLNSIAMDPMGHLAGMTASVVSSLATVGAVLIAVPIGLAFDGSPVPSIVGVLLCSALGCLLTVSIRPTPQLVEQPTEA